MAEYELGRLLHILFVILQETSVFHEKAGKPPQLQAEQQPERLAAKSLLRGDGRRDLLIPSPSNSFRRAAYREALKKIVQTSTNFHPTFPINN